MLHWNIHIPFLFEDFELSGLECKSDGLINTDAVARLVALQQAVSEMRACCVAPAVALVPLLLSARCRILHHIFLPPRAFQ